MSLSETAPSNNLKTIGFWVLKIALALLFLAAGGAKLYGAPMLVSEFETIGLGQWFRYFTGLMEVGGAILLLVPGTTFFGAIMLTAVSIGAFFAQILVLHQDFIHAIVLAVLLAAVAWSQRKHFLG